MSGHSNSEALEVIREEQCSPAISSVNMDEAPCPETPRVCDTECVCTDSEAEVGNEAVDNILREKEAVLEEEFEKKLEKEIVDLKSKFDFILHNEQVRASYMLREAHRERQEKITALQAQLECKNLAGLMLVLCSERRKSKLEKLRLIEEYTGYIRALQQILAEGQQLILHLSRGYKSASRVDHEWREKMTHIIKEFQAYIQHYGGGTPESNQYLFDLPALLKTEAALQDNPKEDTCEAEEQTELEGEVEKEEGEKPWYETLEGECRPFVMFGDMAEFKPPERRTVLKAIKAEKTAPKCWKDYVFNEMYLRADCSNANEIKDEFVNHLPAPVKWECMAVQTDRQSRTSVSSRRMTTPSLEMRGNMGSILKLITANVNQPNTKATLLGARDSMEIASTTKMREKHKMSDAGNKVVICVGNRKESYNEEEIVEDEIEEPFVLERRTEEHLDDDEEFKTTSKLQVTDSLEIIASHVAEKDKVNYEKVCPVDACQRMHVDSFISSLPPYMRRSPFMHFENTFDNYETCSPEQLEILKQRIEDKKKREKSIMYLEEDNLSEWGMEVAGVAVQTSEESLPPCTCIVPDPTPVSSVGRVFDMEDLIPIKQTMDEIRRECFYDDDIEFDRFRVIGQQDSTERRFQENIKTEEEFTKKRLFEIKKILKRHPSLCEIFQANTKC